MKWEVLINGRAHVVELERTENGLACIVDGERLEVDVASTARDVLSILHEGRSYQVGRECTAGGEMHIIIGSERFRAEVRDPRSWRGRRGELAGEAGPVGIHAPMPGKVIRLLAAQGDAVEAGQALLVIEAMKMQNEIRATKTGKLVKIAVAAGSAVNGGDVLVEIE